MAGKTSPFPCGRQNTTLSSAPPSALHTGCNPHTRTRSRLPLTAGTFSSRFTIKRLNNGSAGDAAANGSFPVAHTCFFQIDLPCYTSKQALREKLLCVSFFLSFIYESQTIIISFVLE